MPWKWQLTSPGQLQLTPRKRVSQALVLGLVRIIEPVQAFAATTKAEALLSFPLQALLLWAKYLSYLDKSDCGDNGMKGQWVQMQQACQNS